MKQRMYICIDLKSFYASVECRERGLDPFVTNLVVADPDRTDKTICLAVSPAMKKLGVPGRCRVFEIPKHLDYVMAPPRMQLYIDYAVEIYGVYLKYIAKEDIHVYSIDEVFMDITNYLVMYQMTPKELAQKMMDDVYQHTGITATCGIGTNLYLAKVALDITAKHVESHIGELDEKSYCNTLWNHQPITDFWRVGKGTAKRLQSIGVYTMGDVAHADEDMLYKLFGIDAELLIDHAWGRETTLMSDIKAYKSQSTSLGSGQVLGEDCDYETGKLIVKEMVDLLCLEMVEQGVVTDSITLHVGYSNRLMLKPAHGTAKMAVTTSSAKQIIGYTMKLYERIVEKQMPIRRFSVTFNRVVNEEYQQYDLFTNAEDMEREHIIQKVMLEIKDRFGKNAILKGMNLQEGATTRIRNQQIGGHRSGE